MDRIQVKEAETKKAQVNAKRQEREELEIIKLRKASTFKASPLPSFYHRKDFPPKPELKKIPVTRPKSPLLGQRSKSVQNSEHKKTEEKGKGVSRTITSSAKEAITKLLRTTRKSTTSQSFDEECYFDCVMIITLYFFLCLQECSWLRYACTLYEMK
ncbi:hypothetical protein L1049_022003 [Liquidambar formosana]|uniref:TPX2 C-terminal domain-containing protein n=1 Tax=Liquidambar formosana TaxID=63359 RepID=A0AAP0WPM4_LIQFO